MLKIFLFYFISFNVLLLLFYLLFCAFFTLIHFAPYFRPPPWSVSKNCRCACRSFTNRGEEQLTSPRHHTSPPFHLLHMNFIQHFCCSPHARTTCCTAMNQMPAQQWSAGATLCTTTVLRMSYPNPSDKLLTYVKWKTKKNSGKLFSLATKIICFSFHLKLFKISLNTIHRLDNRLQSWLEVSGGPGGGCGATIYAFEKQQKFSSLVTLQLWSL